MNNSLGLRFTNPLLSDIRVRQALVHGVDAQEVVDTIFTENYPVATSELAATAKGYTDESDALAYDPEQSEELLDEAGWTVGADGIREKDGQRLSLTVYEAKPQPLSKQTLELVSQQLAKIGVELNVKAADAGSYATDILDPLATPLYHSMVGRADNDVIKSQYHTKNRNTLLSDDAELDAPARGRGLRARPREARRGVRRRAGLPHRAGVRDPALRGAAGVRRRAVRARLHDRGGRPPAVLRHLARQAVAGTTVRRMPGHDPAHPPHRLPLDPCTTPAFGRSRDMAYLARRTGQALIVLAIAFTATFVLLQALPGDAILIKFESPELGLSPEQIADIRASYGADVPPLQQFLHTVAGFVQGDFGYSVQYGTPVHELIGSALPDDARCSPGSASSPPCSSRSALAFLSTLAPFAWLRQALRALPGVFVSVPVFWLGIVLIQVFSFQLRLVPVIGADPAQALILPVLTLAIPISAPLAQILARVDRRGAALAVRGGRARQGRRRRPGAVAGCRAQRAAAGDHDRRRADRRAHRRRRRDRDGVRPRRHRPAHRAGRRQPGRAGAAGASSSSPRSCSCS